MLFLFLIILFNPSMVYSYHLKVKIRKLLHRIELAPAFGVFVVVVAVVIAAVVVVVAIVETAAVVAVVLFPALVFLVSVVAIATADCYMKGFLQNKHCFKLKI